MFLKGLKIFVLLLAPAAAMAQSPLTFGRTVQGSTGPDAVYRVDVESPGVLVVAAHGEVDLRLEVSDEMGQTLTDGLIDQDRNGNPGLEYGGVAIPAAGAYFLEVRVFGAESSGDAFTLATTFLPFAALAGEAPRGPGQATPVTAGESREGMLPDGADGGGNWYVVAAPSAGTVTVATRSTGDDDGDLVLEAFKAGNLRVAVARSDFDLEGDPAYESVSVEVSAGEEVYVHVMPWSSSGAGITYRLTVELTD